MPETSFTNLIDLAAEKLGGKALLCSDDFFAEKENLLKPGRGVFIEGKYTDRGKWMDGNHDAKETLEMTGVSYGYQLPEKFMGWI